MFVSACECVHAYYLQLQVVSQAGRAVHSQQDGMFLLGAKAQGQPVSSGAGTLIGRPGVDHHPAVPAKDVGGASWSEQEELNKKCMNCELCGLAPQKKQARI